MKQLLSRAPVLQVASSDQPLVLCTDASNKWRRGDVTAVKRHRVPPWRIYESEVVSEGTRVVGNRGVSPPGTEIIQLLHVREDLLKYETCLAVSP